MKEDAPARQPTRHAQISNFSLQLQPTLTEMTGLATLLQRMHYVFYNFSHTGADTRHFI